MKLSFISPDKELAEKGVWKKFAEPIDGKQTELLIAFAGNALYDAKLARLSRNAAQQLAGRDVPPETLRKLERRAMVGTVFLGWKEIDQDDGQPYEMLDEHGKLNEKNAEAILENYHIRNFVLITSNRLEEFKKGSEAASEAAIKSDA